MHQSSNSEIRAGAWGLAAHQAVTARAIDGLPKGLKDYYKAHRLEMPTLSLEASEADAERTAARELEARLSVTHASKLTDSAARRRFAIP